MNLEELPDQYPVIERTVWIGKKEKLLEKFAGLSGRHPQRFNIGEQLDEIEKSGVPGLVKYTVATEKGIPTKMFPSEITFELKIQWVHIEDLEVSHFAYSL